MKLYINAEMLAVCFHCVKWNCLDAFSAFQRTQRERTSFYSVLSFSLRPTTLFSSSSGPDNFPQRAPFFFYRLLFRAPHSHVYPPASSKRSRAGPGALVCELRRACFLRERAWCSIEQKYARNSSYPSSPSLRPHAE